jgi:hypothetical protein
MRWGDSAVGVRNFSRRVRSSFHEGALATGCPSVRCSTFDGVLPLKTAATSASVTIFQELIPASPPTPSSQLLLVKVKKREFDES